MERVERIKRWQCRRQPLFLVFFYEGRHRRCESELVSAATPSGLAPLPVTDRRRHRGPGCGRLARCDHDGCHFRLLGSNIASLQYFPYWASTVSVGRHLFCSACQKDQLGGDEGGLRIGASRPSQPTSPPSPSYQSALARQPLPGPGLVTFCLGLGQKEGGACGTRPGSLTQLRCCQEPLASAAGGRCRASRGSPKEEALEGSCFGTCLA